MKIQVDLSKITKENISADEYIFLYLRLLGKEPPSTISDNVSPEKLQQKGFIKKNGQILSKS